MSMKANTQTDAWGNITIHMNGKLSICNSEQFEDELRNIMGENPTSLITLNLNSLDFVGSSGISPFINSVKRLNMVKDQIRLSNVKSEFLKVFKLFDLKSLEDIIIDFDNDETDNLSQQYANRRATYEN